MSTDRLTTTNYSGRLVDLELLQSVPRPMAIVGVTLGIAQDTPKIVAGIEKLAQRYAMLFLTVLGSVQYKPEQGCPFLEDMAAGVIQTRGNFLVTFAVANADVLAQLQETNQADILGEVPLDEQISTATLVDYNLDFINARLTLRILITNKAGDQFDFIIPTTAPRR